MWDTADRRQDYRGLLEEEVQQVGRSNMDRQPPPNRYDPYRSGSAPVYFQSEPVLPFEEQQMPQEGSARVYGYARDQDYTQDRGTWNTRGQPEPIENVPYGNQNTLNASPPLPRAYSPRNSSRESPIHTPGYTQPYMAPNHDWQRGEGGYLPPEDVPAKNGTDREDISKKDTPYDPEYSRGHQRGISLNSGGDSDMDDGYDGLNKGFPDGCPPTHDIHYRTRFSGLSIAVLIFSFLSTALSALWLLLAIWQPRYGTAIHSGGKFTPATASTVFALFAKLIELTFVTIFVTFLGQVISRRAIVQASRGVTVPELAMRTWVIQPGFMFTHWQHIQHAGVTVLTLLSVAAAFSAMFYTTASDALVSPHLKYGKWESITMHGLVQSSYANRTFILDNCQTPITSSMNDPFSGPTCLAIEHAGQSYHNWLGYLSNWTVVSEGGPAAPTNLAERFAPQALLVDNTTVIGSWVNTNTSDVASAFAQYSRVVNNVTMSLPHAGVFYAAHDPKNGILQPEDLAGVGEYSIRASVVSPSLNVLCANMNSVELSPLLYVNFPNAQTNTTSIPGQRIPADEVNYISEIVLEPGQAFLNSTVVDDIFEWGAKFGRQPPIFPNAPIDFNSISNANISLANGTDSIYLLFKSAATTNYTLCQMRSYLSPDCSTQYNVSGTAQGVLASNCLDPNDKSAFSRTVSNPSSLGNVVSTSWPAVAVDWVLSLSLNGGISNGNASTDRLLSQLIVTENGDTASLNPRLPSLSEALSVLAANTLLLSATEAQFNTSWAGDEGLAEPTYMPFAASMSSEQYTSGYLSNWQIIFYLPLSGVFICNLFCLIYLLVRSGLVTDFTQPQNLFAIAINSPPSTNMRGSCGSGPEKAMLDVPYWIKSQEGTGHYYIGESGPEPLGNGASMRPLQNRKSMNSQTSFSSYGKLSSKRKSFL